MNDKNKNKKSLISLDNITKNKNEIFSLDNEDIINDISKSLFDIKKYYSPLNNEKDIIIKNEKDNLIKEIKELNTSIITNEKNLDKSLNSSIESLCPKDTNVYLKPYNWDKYIIDEKSMKEIIIKLMTNEEIIEFKKNIEKMNLTGPDCDEVILFSNISYLSKFENDEEICTTKKKRKELMFRKIKGDGNCYYRSIMFSLIENCILNKDIIFIKKIFGNFLEKSKNKILITMFNGLNLDIKLVKKCFIMIYLSLTSKSRNPILKTYLAFIKLINNYKDFDYGLILFFKFILYEYISNNKKSTYSFKFQVLIGNLLPYDCQSDEGNFNFNYFYKNYLMKFYQYAEKIIIYLTPFIFGKEIIIRYINDNGDIEFNSQEIEFGKNLSIIDFDENNKIQLLYKKSHYDILYSNEYYIKYKNIFKYTLLYLINNFKEYKCEICNKNDEKNSVLIKLESDIENKDIINNDYENYLYQKNNNNIIICYKCLYNEIKKNLMILYINFIKKIKKYFLDNFSEKIQDFLTNEFTLSNKIYTISYNKAIKTLSLYKVKYTFDYIMNQIKQEICIYCTNHITKKKLVQLRCKCLLCSSQCLKEFYYILISSAIIKQEFICFCNKKYSIEDCIILIEKLNEKKFNCKEMIELLFNKINKNICFLCNKKNIENYKECLLIEPNFYLNRIIKHFLCLECFDKNNNFIGQNINCKICKRNHIIDKIYDKIKDNNIKGYNLDINNINNKKKNNVNVNNNYFDKKIDDKQYKKIEKMEINPEIDNNIEENITIIKIHKKRKSNK